MADRSPASDDAVARDAWLREALRHAPDADVRPPPALRDAILRQARIPSARRPGLWARVEAAMSWLARPPVAAGLATLTLSTVIVVMWRNGPPDEATAPVASNAPLRAASAPPPAAPVERRAEAQATPVERRAAAPKAMRWRAQKAQVPPEAPPAAAPAPAPRTEAGVPPAQEPAPQDLAAPRPAPAGPAALMAKRERAASAEALQRSDRALSFAPTALDPLPPVAELLAARGPALHWSLGERSIAHGSAQQAWFEQLRSVTAGRWQRAPGPPADGAPLRLFEGNELRAEFIVSAQQVWWVSPAHGAWRALLSDAEAAQLQALAARW